ncbi:hypothetical protein ACWEQ4_01540 [Rhodococcus sp. NPDC003994]
MYSQDIPPLRHYATEAVKIALVVAAVAITVLYFAELAALVEASRTVEQ